jgi:hypothetical protein
MTKKEQAIVDALRIKAALGWPQFEKPEPKDLTKIFIRETPSRYLEVGWFVNTYNGTVTQGCSSSIYHDTQNTTKTSTQTRGVQYHTRKDALIVARWELCERFAQQLAKLDAEIEKEIQSPTP